jgi:hypothetical protein
MASNRGDDVLRRAADGVREDECDAADDGRHANRIDMSGQTSASVGADGSRSSRSGGRSGRQAARHTNAAGAPNLS